MWKLYTQCIIPSLEHITRKLPETAYSGSAEWLLIIPIEESTNQKTEKLPDSNRSGEISSKYRKLNSVLYADFSFLPDRTSPSRPNLILKFCPGLLLTTLQAHVRIMQLSGLTKSPLERHHWRQQRVELWKEYYQENVGGKLSWVKSRQGPVCLEFLLWSWLMILYIELDLIFCWESRDKNS